MTGKEEWVFEIGENNIKTKDEILIEENKNKNVYQII